MIIKNNFNNKEMDPLNDYHKIGKGSKSLEHQYEMEKEGFIKENMNDSIVQDVLASDHAYDNTDRDEDKWDFFR